METISAFKTISRKLLVFLFIIFSVAKASGQGYVVKVVLYDYDYMKKDSLKSTDTIVEKYDASKRLVFKKRGSKIIDGLAIMGSRTLDSTDSRTIRRIWYNRDSTAYIDDLTTKDSTYRVSVIKNDTSYTRKSYYKNGKLIKVYEKLYGPYRHYTTTWQYNVLYAKSLQTGTDSNYLIKTQKNRLTGYVNHYRYNKYLNEWYKSYRFLDRHPLRSKRYVKKNKRYVEAEHGYSETRITEKHIFHKKRKEKNYNVEVWRKFNDGEFRLLRKEFFIYD